MAEDDLELFPLGFGVYPGQDALNISDKVSVDDETRLVAAALAPFGARTSPWDVDMPLRGADATDDRLSSWVERKARHSVLLWMGHGWSDKKRGALAHALTPDRNWSRAISPDKLAAFIAEHQDPYDSGQWTVVALEACDSATFVKNLRALVDEADCERLLLVGFHGAVRIGTLSDALTIVLNDTFQAEAEIPLARLQNALSLTLGVDNSEVESVRIGAAVLRRQTPIVVGTTIDLAEEVRSALAKLGDDERAHFLPKARGGDGDDHAWYFHGRAAEIGRVVTWLSTTSTGLLAVTGPPGSGKSALLGQLTVRGRPELREALLRHELLTAMPEVDGYMDHVFDLSVRLTGMTTAELIDDIAEGLGLGDPPPAPRDNRVAWLMTRLGTRAPVTLLLDALDEAVDPLETAEALVRPVSSVEGVRVVLGTRHSTAEAGGTGGRNLLEALAAADVVEVEHDDSALSQYVTARLDGVVDAIDLVDLAGLIARSHRDFLFARLVVTEVLATPDWLHGDGLDLLTSDGRRSVFAAAVARLAAEDPVADPLLRALALARGRGLPIEDGIWGVLAEALSPGAGIGVEHIHRLLRAAAPYVVVDREHGQTVYRLAHRIFVEHLAGAAEDDRTAHAAIARALIRHVRELHGKQPNPYVANHLSAHAAEGGPESWSGLAEAEVIIALDLRSVASDATRVAFGRYPLPPGVAATLTARHVLHTTGPDDRRGLFQLALARHTRHPSPVRGQGTWTVRWAALKHMAVHLTLTEHDRPVETMVSFRTASGRCLLVVGGRDHVVQIWDPSTGQPFGEPFKGHSASITALAPVRDGSGGVLLISADSRGDVLLWDPMSGRPADEPLSERGPVVRSLTAWEDDTGPTVATGDADGVVLIHRLTDRSVVWRRTATAGQAVRGLAVIGGRDRVLVAGDDAGMVHAWPLDRDDVRTAPVAGHRKGVRTLIGAGGEVITSANDGVVQKWTWTGEGLTHRPLVEVGRGLRTVAVTDGTLVAGDNSGWCHRFDLATGEIIGSPWQAHTGRVLTSAFVPFTDDRCLLATGGEDGAVRLWEKDLLEPPPDTRIVEVVEHLLGTVVTGSADGTVRRYDAWTGAFAGDLGRAHRGKPVALDAWTSPGGVEWVASGGTDRVVQVLSAKSSSEFTEDKVVRAVAGFTTAAERTFLVTASGNDLVFRELAEGVEAQHRQGAHHADVRVLTTFTAEDGRTVLASGGDDCMVRLWNPETGVAERVLKALPGKVNAIAAVQVPGTGLLLAVATNEDTVRLWDPRTGREAGFPLKGHRGPVCAVANAGDRDGRPVLVTAGSDRTLREWDPSTGAMTRSVHVALPMTSVAVLGDGLVAVAGVEGMAVLSLGGDPDR